MNFDELQQLWKDESTNSVEIPENISELAKRTYSLIESVKRRIQKKYIKQCITFPIIIILYCLVIFNYASSNPYTPFNFMIIFIYSSISILYLIYYFSLFKSEKVNTNWSNHQKLIYDFHRLNILIQRYKDFKLVMILPISAAITGFYFIIRKTNIDSVFTILELIAISLISTLITSLITVYYNDGFIKNLNYYLTKIEENMKNLMKEIY